MHVQQLINELQELIRLDPNAAGYRVLLSRDPEGNGYSEFFQASISQFQDDEPVDLALGEPSEPNSVVLWPT